MPLPNPVPQRDEPAYNPPGFLSKTESDQLADELLRNVPVPHQLITSFSGGKDSTAIYLLMLEKELPFRSVFADVENEHPATVDFVRNISKLTGGPEVEFVKADLTGKFATKRKTIRETWSQPEYDDNGSMIGLPVPDDVIERALKACHPSGNVFVDLCLLRAGFPTIKKKYCTEQLKQVPIDQQINEPLRAQGIRPISVIGVRAEESIKRASYPIAESVFPNGELGTQTIVRPIFWWSVSDVWAIHKRHGIQPNKLYSLGFKRVGCMPCINSRKHDIRLIARHFPEHIDRIAEWESIVALATKKKTPSATFFHVRGHTKVHKDLIATDSHGIRAAVEWSQTTRGGKVLDLFEIGGLPCDEQGFCE